MCRATSTEDVARLWEANAEEWTRLSRAGHDIYRDAHNTPAFLSALPDVGGMPGLDIGCGEGTNTRAVAKLGARMTGIDVASTFIRHARETEAANSLGIDFEIADATSLPFEDYSFDFAVAFMSMMDVASADLAVAEVFRVLKLDGFFQFSILHPCFAPPMRRPLRDDQGNVYAIEVADYFVENDGTIEEWTFGRAKRFGDAVSPFRVPRFHRTLSGWINLLTASGFDIEHLNEPTATAAQATAYPDIADTRVAPLFLHLRVRKPKSRVKDIHP